MRKLLTVTILLVVVNFIPKPAHASCSFSYTICQTEAEHQKNNCIVRCEDENPGSDCDNCWFRFYDDECVCQFYYCTGPTMCM